MKTCTRAAVLVVTIVNLISAAGVDVTATNVSQLPYAELKKMFEEDETLEGIRVTGYTASQVTIVYKGRYLNYELNKLSPAQRAKVDNLLALEKEQRRQEMTKEHEEAARAGMLREVDGMVYNLMRPTPDWVTFRNVRAFQKSYDGILVDTEKSAYDFNIIFVENLPNFDRVADNDTITFTAKHTGTYTYITRAGTSKTVHKYDCGTIPGTKKAPGLVRSPTDTRKAVLDPAWDSSGTGFFITTDGHLVTCNHVVEGGKRFAVKHSTGTLNAKVIAHDASNDLAIVKVEGTFPALSINTNPVSLGQSVFTIGFPNVEMQGLAPKYTDGKVSSVTGLRDEEMNIQISVPVQPGNSGGPLVDPQGSIVGVVVARLSDYAALRRTRSIPQNVNYAVKTVPLFELIKQAGLKDKVSFTASTNEKVLERVEKATVLVLVSDQ